MHWNDLSLKDKSDLMRLYIKNGIYSLEEMKKDFNESSKKYDMGGPLEENPPKMAPFILGTGFDRYGRSVVTEEDIKREQQTRKAQEVALKRSAETLLRPLLEKTYSITQHNEERKNIDNFLKEYYQSDAFKNKVARLDNPEKYLKKVQEIQKHGSNSYNPNKLTFSYMHSNDSINAWYNHKDNTILYNPKIEKRKSNMTFPYIYAHERGHSLDPNRNRSYELKGEFGLPEAPSREILDLLLDYKIDGRSTRQLLGTTEKDIENNKFVSDFNKVFGGIDADDVDLHDRNYKEIYADYIATIYDMYKLGIWDARKNKLFDKHLYKKYKNYYKNKGNRQRLLENTDEDTFIKIINTFASNNLDKYDVNNPFKQQYLV